MQELQEVTSARRKMRRKRVADAQLSPTESLTGLTHTDSGLNCDSTFGLADAQNFSSTTASTTRQYLSQKNSSSPSMLKTKLSAGNTAATLAQKDANANHGIFTTSPSMPAAAILSGFYRSRKNNTASDNSKLTNATLRNALPQPSLLSRVLLTVVFIVSLFSRFFSISNPSQVIFDEVHFGKFMAYYIRRTYYFDVHPPLGRLLFALVGWAAGFDGSFLFEKIGEDYVKNKIPYVLLRSWPAFCSALAAPIAFETMRHLGFSSHASFLASMLIILDNALVTQSKLIMLDSALILFVALSIYSWVRFSNAARTTIPFTAEWWKWLLMTGVSLGCVMGVKMVGLFTVATIGVAVIYDLWYLLDEKINTTKEFLKHFAARSFALIVLPCSLYLLWFYIHFAVLTKSGPGDGFMSPSFQATLHGNKHSGDSNYVPYGTVITIKHIKTNGYLHSHVDRYPLRYEDNRVSSQGQQVTVYPHNDSNNDWRILPADPSGWNVDFKNLGPRLIQHNDMVVLQHIRTDTHLLTHDVASPLTPTNQEFTTVAGKEKLDKHNMTVFRIDMGKEFKDIPPGPARALTTLSSHFRLIHAITGVSMYTHSQPLPKWGFGQQEVNGNKNPAESANKWYIEATDNSIFGKNAPPQPPQERLRRPGFLAKFFELQNVMVTQNAQITKPHPYTSSPYTWPIFQRGISYWQSIPGKQIYLLSNAASYSVVLVTLGAYLITICVNLVLERRGKPIIVSRHTRARAFVSLGFLLFAWAAHYLPFFGMGRSLFLHHYLPASVIAYMFAGGVIDTTIKLLLVILGVAPRTKSGPTLLANAMACSITIAVLSISAGFFFKYLPLTYGREALSEAEWEKLRYISTWDILFTKPPAE